MPKQPLPLADANPWDGAFARLKNHNHWITSRVSIHIGTGVVFVQVLIPGTFGASEQAHLPPGDWGRVSEALDALAWRMLESGRVPECNRGPNGEIPDQTYGAPIPAEPVMCDNMGCRNGLLFSTE